MRETRLADTPTGDVRAETEDQHVAKVTMPQLGESVAEGTIGKWLKQPGDHVAKYEPLLEVITDKVNAEVPSPFEGILKEILVEEGATVPNNAEIAVIEEAGAAAAARRRGRLPRPPPPPRPPLPPTAPDGRRQATLPTRGAGSRSQPSRDRERAPSRRRRRRGAPTRPASPRRSQRRRRHARERRRRSPMASAAPAAASRTARRL